MSKTIESSLARQATRNTNRVAIVDQNFLKFVDDWEYQPSPASRNDRLPGTDLSGNAFLELFESQMLSRHLDFQARAMRAKGAGFYTIGSSGHEGNVLLGRLARPTDPAFLHYRSGALFVERARASENVDPVVDIALSLAASASDPISGGRHKVFGSVPLWVVPQTSTIASHLPKAVGAAFAIDGKVCPRDLPVPKDSIVLCSFGDASANHATALAGLNAAAWACYQGLPCPILFICEDNGLGISVETPEGWIEKNFANRPGLRYVAADGLDILHGYSAVRDAVNVCREDRCAVFLHLRCVRLLGHAGTDIETEYLGDEKISRSEALDPLIFSADTALESGLLSKSEVLDRYEACRRRVEKAVGVASRSPRLSSAKNVMAPLQLLGLATVHREANCRDPDFLSSRIENFGGEEFLPERDAPRHLSIQINRGLTELLTKYKQATLFGEDVAKKGGVYTVTSGLLGRFGGSRVFDTLLDETSILGLAQGQAMMNLLPFPEIQYLAYLHNALDQIRGEAASLEFFSSGQYHNGMVVRVASFAYQKGFGGHFHNDNSFNALRDIPGIVIVSPSNGEDAVGLLRTGAALAKVKGKVVVILEPIALYMTKDLYEVGDGKWLRNYPRPGISVPFGKERVYNPDGSQLAIITYGNGVPMALRAAKRLSSNGRSEIRVIDLRWLKPLNERAIIKHAQDCGRLLVVDEGRRTGGLSEEIFSVLADAGVSNVRTARVTGKDSFIPLGDAANLVLVTEQGVIQAARRLLAQS